MKGAKHKGLLVVAGAALLSACGSSESPSSYFEYASQGLYSATLSPQGNSAIVGSIQHGGSLWITNNNERIYNWNHQQGEYSNIIAAAFSPEQKFAVTADQQTMVLWEANNGNPVWFWNAPAAILDIDLTQNAESALLGLANHQAVYFDVQNGGIQQTLYHQARVSAVDSADDGRYALTGSDDYRAIFWDVANAEILQFQQHENRVNTVALSPNGKVAFSAGQLEQAKLWDTNTGQVLQVLSGDEIFVKKRHSYTAAVFSDSGDQLLTGTSAGKVQLWDVRQGALLKSWELHRKDPLRPTSVYVMSVAFSGSGYKAIASNGFINELQ